MIFVLPFIGSTLALYLSVVCGPRVQVHGLACQASCMDLNEGRKHEGIVT